MKGMVIPPDHRAAWHQAVEKGRDRTHTRNLTVGELCDIVAAAGAGELTMREEPFSLDFDEWFDRGTPSTSKADLRAQLLSSTARGFAPVATPDGAIRIISRARISA